MSLRKQRLEEFESFYEIKTEQWHKAMITGDTSSLEADMVEGYKVFFFKKKLRLRISLQLKRQLPG